MTKRFSGDKTAPGDKGRCALRMPKGRAASTAAVAIDGADSKGKANDNEVRASRDPHPPLSCDVCMYCVRRYWLYHSMHGFTHVYTLFLFY